MSVIVNSLRCSAVVFALVVPAASHAQAPQLPPPADPIALGIMQGFPPPADKIVTRANVLRYPNGSWAYHNMRQIVPNVSVWRGDKGPSVLANETRNLDTLAFQGAGDAQTTLADWQKSTYTDALLVLHNGKTVYERYHNGMKAQTPHSMWSLTKSVVGLLATMLIKEGKLDPNAKIPQYLPELASSGWADATLQQALDMTTGLQYREVFTDPKAEIFQYIIAAGLLPAPPDYPGPKSMLEYLKTVKKNGEHGDGFRYKSVDVEVLGWVIQRVTGKSFSDLVSERLWSKLAAQEDGYVLADPVGSQITSIGMNATLRDLGRLGEMLRQDGRFNGQQIVPKAVVDEIRKGADREKFKTSGQTLRAGYSYHNNFWVTHNAAGAYEMKGLNGQHVHINPSAGVVIVKLSSHPAGETIFTHVVDQRAFEAIAKAVSKSASAK